VTVSRTLQIEVAGPGGPHMLVACEAQGQRRRCKVDDDRPIEITCASTSRAPTRCWSPSEAAPGGCLASGAIG